jgi:hypothetical protein
MRNSREDKARITWIGLALQAAWRTGTMVSRIMALLVCASVIHLWFLLAITIHWVGMTLWTIKQKTDLCSTAWEERIYNAVVGVIYCFCFFNVKVRYTNGKKKIIKPIKFLLSNWIFVLGRTITPESHSVLHSDGHGKRSMRCYLSSIFPRAYGSSLV